MELKQLPIEILCRGRFQPRRHFDPDSLKELADSILSQGLIEPLIVRPLAENDTYEIIAGERRWRAAMLAGLTEVPCLIGHYTDEQTAAVSIIENIQREDLSPLEEAEAYQRLLDEFCFVQEDIAQMVGKSRSHIANMLRLLSLAPSVKKMLFSRELSFGHARALVGLSFEEQSQLANQSIQYHWSVRKLEQQVKQNKNGKLSLPGRTDYSPDFQYLSQHISEYLGTPVEIDSKEKGGWLRIRYFDYETLSGILERMGLKEEVDI